MYEYRAVVSRVVDGDTVDVSIDLGLEIYAKKRIRLFGINAPEMNTPNGPAAKKRLQELLPVGSEVVLRTRKDKQEKYGRYLGIFIDAEGHEVNQRMIDEGFAEPFLN
jgi:endonuclease YncB( thermonuclease family)